MAFHEYYSSEKPPHFVFLEGDSAMLLKIRRMLESKDKREATYSHPVEAHAQANGIEIVPVEDSPESRLLRKEHLRIISKRDKFEQPEYLKKKLSRISFRTIPEALRKIGVNELDRQAQRVIRKRENLMVKRIKARVRGDLKKGEPLYYRMSVGGHHFTRMKSLLRKEFGKQIQVVELQLKASRK
jgi:hypothetical protein